MKTKTLVKDKKAAVPENDFGQDSTDFVKKRKRRVYKVTTVLLLALGLVNKSERFAIM